MAEAKSRREMTPRPRVRGKTDLPGDADEQMPDEGTSLLTEPASPQPDTLEPRSLLPSVWPWPAIAKADKNTSSPWLETPRSPAGSLTKR